MPSRKFTTVWTVSTQSMLAAVKGPGKSAGKGATADNRPVGGGSQKNGRGERIRTSGPCLPKTVLYQAELLPDSEIGCDPDEGRRAP